MTTSISKPALDQSDESAPCGRYRTTVSGVALNCGQASDESPSSSPASRDGSLWGMARARSTASSSRIIALTGAVGGIAAVAAGLCWAVKALVILATGRQPPLLFEMAPLLMAFAVLSLALELPTGRPQVVAACASTVAVLGGVVVLLSHLVPVSATGYGVAMASANLLVLVGLVSAGLSLHRQLRESLPLALGLVTIPALLAGGLAAALVGERALELPLVALGAAWMVLGVLFARGRYGRA